MRDTRTVLQQMATHIDHNGLHRGEQFAQPGPVPRLDICAVAYVVAERLTPDRYPAEFFTDEVASIRLIESSASAMAAIQAISHVLDSAVCETQIEPGTWVPDYIEHVSNWAATASPVHPKRPPTNAEVIGRIHRAINTLAIQTPAAPAA
ncbi:hypothetical protein [Streptomyces glaucescens]|uniref:hypothetical protein n=1 Tax=Streptomyces glaucescens TaxID=1907 RepID=UPI000A3A6415|nr:hypothetical protein [Streptomyces glaucescens]